MKLGYARAVLVVHNIAHQGRTHCDDVWKLGLPDHHTGAFYLDDPQAGVYILAHESSHIQKTYAAV